MRNSCERKVLALPIKPAKARKSRKTNFNKNRDGSVRKINGLVYVDFIYLGVRVREPSGLTWNEKNARTVREQLDRVIFAIKSKTFRFAEVFPHSKKRDYFQRREMIQCGLKRRPEDVGFGEAARQWYSLRRESQRVSGRTLLGYKSYLDAYLIPFFGDMTFSQLNAAVFEKFISWARKRKLVKKSVCNATINKFFIPLKMICKHVAIEHGWAGTFDPFFGFSKLPESDRSEKIFPFSLKEQEQVSEALPDHWKPYFEFAFCSGLRPGEQIALKADDIDWQNGSLHVRRAITMDEEGKRVEGETKNRYSRRKIKLTEVMLDALTRQKAIYDTFKGEYFFCTEDGGTTYLSNLRQRVWIPALKKANVRMREMKQTRHSFATNALSFGENPLWIAKVMGHCNTEMIIKVYSRHIEDAKGIIDGDFLTKAYRGLIATKEDMKR
jgi:integrase